MASNARTTQDVRRDIAREREELAEAVDELRGDLASDIRSKLPVAAAGAATVGFVLAGGIGATMRYIARRGREGDEKARVGRFRILRR
jgi:hypothetical protein